MNLIITTPHLADMDAAELARRVKAEGLDAPVVLLAWDTRELADFHARHDTSDIERTFLWQGDARILVGIVKSVEDRRNALHDTREVGVQVILLVEDNVRYYSSFLPVMYTELLHHSQRVIKEGLNISQQILRMRARPKILLCTTWEEAEDAFATYGDDVLGIISDVEFPRGGRKYAQAGADFARHVRGVFPDVPIVLHSSRPENEALARSLGADFLLKGSPLLLQELRDVMLEHFGFGDFVFRTADGTEVGRARRPARPRGEARDRPRGVDPPPRRPQPLLALAQGPHRVRPRPRAAAAPARPTTRAARRCAASLIRAIAEYRRDQARVLVTDFDRDDFDLSGDFYRMGGGSLGGKARGLAFVRRLLAEQGLRDRFPGVEIAVPVVGGRRDGHLRPLPGRQRPALVRDRVRRRRRDPGPVRRRGFPREAAQDVAAFLERATWPLAVRSSSLLEDSQHQPFTGVYDTLMLANNSWSHGERTHLAISAIKRVYASTFSQHAKGYLKATPYRLEEEKMAVILQRIVGRGARRRASTPTSRASPARTTSTRPRR